MAGTFDNYVVFQPAALAELLRGPDGPVVRDLIEKGERVKTEAKRLVGVYVPKGESPAPRRRKPGTLRDSIVKRVADAGGEVEVLVGTDDPIGLLHHEGTQAHIIRARQAPMLAFYWPRVGQVVRVKQVNHPGTRPNRFLTNALQVLH